MSSISAWLQLDFSRICNDTGVHVSKERFSSFANKKLILKAVVSYSLILLMLVTVH